MSMISTQCDKLRAMAESVGLAMPQAATLMMGAADTIDELRGALQVASADYRHLQADRDRLREELAKARDPQRIGGQADPSSFVYAIEQLREFRWQHATNDEDAIPYINGVADAHEREIAKLQNDADLLRAMLSQERTEKHGYMAELETQNAKLLELIADVHEALCADKVGMFHKLTLASMEDDMRELGVEVEP